MKDALIMLLAIIWAFVLLAIYANVGEAFLRWMGT